MTSPRSPPRASWTGCWVPEPRLRRARGDDIEAILAIYNASVAVDTASWDSAPQTLAERQAWFEERAAAGHAVLVAVDDADTVLGWGSWGPFRAKHGYRLTMEHTLYVAEGARGTGLGRLLLQGLIDTASHAGVHVLVGALTQENTASLALHERLGFVEVGRLPQVGAKFGRWLDLVLVQRILDDAPAPR